VSLKANGLLIQGKTRSIYKKGKVLPQKRKVKTCVTSGKDTILTLSRPYEEKKKDNKKRRSERNGNKRI
jgi:beta-lactam-binding protein with PASTA domain